MTTDHHPDAEPAAEEQDAPEVIERRRFLRTVGTAAAVGLAGAGAITYYALSTGGTASAIECAYRKGEIPLDPVSGVWTRRPTMIVPLLRQNIATPNAQELVIPEIKVRALHNGTDIAFHLEWADATKDEIDAIARFHDAVAVQLSVDAGNEAPIMMGGQQAPVHILQWRASWQADIDHGQRTPKDAFPNMYNDSVPEQWMSVEQAKQFYPAWAVGNALAQRDKKSPVEELGAIGFGSLTTHDQQRATGKGVHDGKRWRVIIAMPMQAQAADKAKVTPGETRTVSFAVWNGERGQRGARKQYALWTPMHVGDVS